MLGDVNVTGEKLQTDQTQDIKIKDIKMAPSANGNGVEGIIQQQAGVSTHNELSSQYNVRGGAFDENSVYINNVEVYRPFLVRSGQQEGLSVINPYMVDKIGFSTGGYGAKYGDKMSSALDITYKKLRRRARSLSGKAARPPAFWEQMPTSDWAHRNCHGSTACATRPPAICSARWRPRANTSQTIWTTRPI